ncbi:transglycosylase domain-containing protein [Alkalicoccobacillus murimartini]|uniref:Penicillin-binding protein 2A n=1 Tax=Alkalicoccobacillus murimartini TaxID=171685 RepID=A0ABT9YC80_9BACI|nr:PBP1A family penicillin-binding protein [Alkalicoccobacillus murimartini]MDQ0205329.1 penicillin-binding protein 2A [Alkalicoccobacillus murimartini]
MLKKILTYLIVAGSALLTGLLVYAIVILAGNYVIDNEKLVMNNSSSLVDESGELITRVYIENRQPVSIDTIPDHVQEAFVAVEDHRFYEHSGIDFRSISRAMYRNILAGGKAEGGSTITQQLTKNVFLTNEKSWLRKIKEVFISINLERRYSKDEILEMYLNQIYFGHGAYGLQTASNLYFNKDVSELTVDEGALLAGLPKAPNNYSPINDPDRSKERRDLILSLMENQGFISAEDSVRLQGKTIALDLQNPVKDEALYTYIDMVMDEAEDRYQLSQEELMTGGYRIVVPMDRSLQKSTYEKLQNDVYYPEGNEDAQASVMMMDSESGGVLAVQGGRDYVRLGLNRVNVKRQPGSTFKPIAVYAPALESGAWNPYSMLRDQKLAYNDFAPENYNDKYEGELSMYDALVQSANAPAVWLMNEVGINRSLDMIGKFGFKITDHRLAIALGGLREGVTPYELTKAYRAFNEEGRVIEPYFIKELYDHNGEKIGEASPVQTEVISKQNAWNMTRMLESVVTDGTGTAGTAQTPIAGKTGSTSNELVDGATMDAWFVGYTPSVVGAVWMGYDSTTEDQYLKEGSSFPTVLFKSIVNDLPSERLNVAFEKPDDVEDLSPPIPLIAVEDLKASMRVGGKGLLSIDLEWTPSEDERVRYNVYEVHNGEREQIAANVEGGTYTLSRLNPFSSKTYEVVPYDNNVGSEGEASNIAEADFSLGFSF